MTGRRRVVVRMHNGLAFHVVRIDTWQDAVDLFRQLGPRWVFRGQSDATWSLATTIERAAARLSCPPEARAEREDCVVNEFQRQAHHYLSDLPELANRLEWLALLQHHGAPTRLLDFTKSFYVAAFFAMESATSNSAIWAVNGDALDDAVARKGGIDFTNISTRRLNDAYITLCNNAYDQSLDCKLVVAVEPERMNPRLAAQKGLFLFPFDLTSTFEDNLAATFGLDAFECESEMPFRRWAGLADREEPSSVLKVVLSRDFHRRAIEDLRMMNVSAEALFPGLDGFARSLTFYVAHRQPDPGSSLG